MTENKNNQSSAAKRGLKLDGLRNEIRDSVKVFAEKLVAELGDNLESITIVGSSLTDDFVASQSDINTVLVLGKQTLDSLNTLAGMAKSMSKKKLAAPLLMTKDYLERSRDVFGIEFLDLQLIHKTVLGEDPFEKLSFAKSDIRLQCERELKATLIRLRQGYIAAAANKKLVRDILASAGSGLVPLLRAMLWLKDIERPNTAGPTLTKTASEFSLNLDAVKTARSWRHQKMRLSENEIQTAFDNVYKTAEQLANIVDKLEE